jgi:hypothetical protein
LSGGVIVEPLGGVAMVGIGDGVEGLVESWNAAAIRWSIPFTADIAWMPDVGFALPDGSISTASKSKPTEPSA